MYLQFENWVSRLCIHSFGIFISLYQSKWIHPLPLDVGILSKFFQADYSFMYSLSCCSPINATGRRLCKANIGSGTVFAVKIDNEFMWHVVARAAPNELNALQYTLHNPKRTCSYTRQLDFNIMVCYYVGFDRMWSVSHRRTEHMYPKLNSQNLTSQWSDGLVYGTQGWSNCEIPYECDHQSWSPLRLGPLLLTWFTFDLIMNK